MKGMWRGPGAGPSRLCLDVALAGLLVVVGCERGEEVDAGEGMEPRIVTEGPVDSPGRPGAREEVASVSFEEEEGAGWVPHLTVGDLATSVAFYRELGFAPAVEGGEAAGRVELERDGVRLVLVAAAGTTDAAEPADEASAAAGAPVPPEDAPLVLHLVDEAGGAGRRVRDPDGHRLVISGGG